MFVTGQLIKSHSCIAKIYSLYENVEKVNFARTMGTKWHVTILYLSQFYD